MTQPFSFNWRVKKVILDERWLEMMFAKKQTRW